MNINYTMNINDLTLLKSVPPMAVTVATVPMPLK